QLIADTGYGSAEMLDWLVHERGIERHIPVFDHSKRKDGTFSRALPGLKLSVSCLAMTRCGSFAEVDRLA
ncbi:MAG: hypothetical protein E5V16_01460, partial [Mesorhizobium sp.]